jgi:carbon monoxide dehydrogenase subunit G
MTRIESKKVVVKATTEQTFGFLMDMNNIRHLLPEDKISNWQSDEKSCSFKIQNAYTISLEYKESTPHSRIVYQSGSNSPFPFTLNVSLDAEENQTKGSMLCEAQINPFLEMMVKGPLTNLFDYMAEKLSKQF